MADDFADEILRDMTIEQIAAKAVDSEQSDGYSHDTELAIATRAACIAARRAITLTRVRELVKLKDRIADLNPDVRTRHDVWVYLKDRIADLERQMREDGK